MLHMLREYSYVFIVMYSYVFLAVIDHRRCISPKNLLSHVLIGRSVWSVGLSEKNEHTSKKDGVRGPSATHCVTSYKKATILLWLMEYNVFMSLQEKSSKHCCSLMRCAALRLKLKETWDWESTKTFAGSRKANRFDELSTDIYWMIASIKTESSGKKSKGRLFCAFFDGTKVFARVYYVNLFKLLVHRMLPPLSIQLLSD